jgi:hypothetical protein
MSEIFSRGATSREIIAPSVLGAGEPPAVPVNSLNDLSASATNVAEVWWVHECIDC